MYTNNTPIYLSFRYYKTDIQGATSGPLKGYKVVMKDNFPVAGVPMMIGSLVFEGFVPDYDATVVTRVLDAGKTYTECKPFKSRICSDFSITPFFVCFIIQKSRHILS